MRLKKQAKCVDVLVELKFEEKSGSLQSQCMKGFGITHVISVTINQCTWKILHFICRHLMTIFAICVISVTLKLHAREILNYMWTLFIRVFNIYELIVDIQVQQRTTLTDICNQCIKKSMIKLNLKRTHKYMMPFMKKYILHANLVTIKQHIMETSKNICSHEGITYPCNYCDCKAKQKQRLLVHVDAIHNKVYYSCEVYEYKTGFEEVLRKH